MSLKLALAMKNSVHRPQVLSEERKVLRLLAGETSTKVEEKRIASCCRLLEGAPESIKLH